MIFKFGRDDAMLPNVGEPQLVRAESSMRGTLATSKKIVCEYLFLTVLIADFGFLCNAAFWASVMGRNSFTV